MTWTDDSAAETLPFTPTGEGGLYAPTEQSPQKAGKVALLPTNAQEICIKYKISLMLCYNEVNSFHVN